MNSQHCSKDSTALRSWRGVRRISSAAYLIFIPVQLAQVRYMFCSEPRPKVGSHQWSRGIGWGCWSLGAVRGASSTWPALAEQVCLRRVRPGERHGRAYTNAPAATDENQ